MPGELVLVVDDDETCRRQCRAALEAARFRVEEAPDGETAEQLLHDDLRLRDNLDLVLVDYTMPGRNGLASFHALRRLRPDLAGILVTGHTSLSIAVEALNRHFSQVLAKPLEVGPLLEAVEAALAERRGLLENARLRALTRLYDALNELASLTEVADVYQCVVRLAVSETSAGSASLMLLDEATRELRIVAAEGLPEEVIGQVSVPMGAPVSGWALRHGTILELAPGRPIPEAVRTALNRPQVKAAVCLPLYPAGRPLGVLNLTRLDGHDRFNPGDLEVATVLADDAALTIERLQILQERRERERAATVGRLASTIIHDVRGPVTIIGGAAEMLEDSNPNAATPLDTIRHRVSQLDRMCRQLLSLARDASTTPPEVLPAGELLVDVAAEADEQLGPDGYAFDLGAPTKAHVAVARDELVFALVDLLEAARAMSPEEHPPLLGGQATEDSYEWFLRGRATGPEGWGHDYDTPAALAAGGAPLSLTVVRSILSRYGGRATYDGAATEYELRFSLPRLGDAAAM